MTATAAMRTVEGRFSAPLKMGKKANSLVERKMPTAAASASFVMIASEIPSWVVRRYERKLLLRFDFSPYPRACIESAASIASSIDHDMSADSERVRERNFVSFVARFAPSVGSCWEA